MPFAQLNGIEIYHEVHGVEDGEWVLNISGTGGDLRRTMPDRSPLNRSFRVIHYDQRGLGQTAKPDGVYTIEQYADDAAAMIEAVAGGPCHVVGTSFGGMVALNLVLRRPDLVKRLALLVTSPGGSHASYRLSDLQGADPDETLPVRMRLLDARWDPDADEPLPGLPALYPVLVERHFATTPPEIADALRRQVEARNGHDVVARLGEIEHETLVVAGRYDELAPVANSEFMVDHMPNATLWVGDGGHLVGFQDRALFPAVIDFLDR